MNKKLIYGGIIVGLLLAGAIVFIVNSQQTRQLNALEDKFPGWTQISGKLMSFRARFPNEPTYATQDLPVPDSEVILKQELYTTEDNGSVYTISAMVYPSDIQGDEAENLRTALNGMVQAARGATLVSQEMHSTPTGKNYLEFTIKKEDHFFKGRLFVSTRTLVQAFVEYSEQSFDNDAYA